MMLPKEGPLTRRVVLVPVSLFLALSLGRAFLPVFGDEIPLFENVLHFVSNRTIVPQQFNYPTFFSYFLALLIGVFAVPKALLFGVPPAEIGFQLWWPVYGTAALTPEVLWIRAGMVALGAATLTATIRMAHILAGRRAAWLAGALLASSWIFVDRASLALPDMLVALLTTTAILVALTVAQRNRERDVPARSDRWTALAIALCGAAVATKYNAAPACLAVLLMWGWGHRVRSVRRWATAAVLLGLGSLAAFFVASPAWLIAPGPYIDGLRFESRHMAEGQLYVDLGDLPYLWIPIRFAQQELLTGVLFLLAIVPSCLSKDRSRLVLVAPVLATIAIVGLWKYTSIHYLLWCFPILAALAAAALADLAQRGRIESVSVAAVAGLAVALNVVRLAPTSWAGLTQPSAMLAAERWIEGNVPAGATVEQNWYGLRSVWNEETRRSHEAKVSPDFSPRVLEAIRSKPIYVGFLGAQYEPPDATGLLSRDPQWIAVNQRLRPPTPEPLASYGSEDLSRLHARLGAYHEAIESTGRWTLVQRFSGPGDPIYLYRRTRS